MALTSEFSERLLVSASRLYRGGEITSAWLRQRFGVSSATAKRYLHHLEIGLPVHVELRPTPGKPQKVPRLVLQDRQEQPC